VHQFFIGFKKIYDSFRWEVLYSYNVIIDFGTPMKLVRLIKMCLNEKYRGVPVGNNLYDMFCAKNGLKQ
jgi:hypothetical protein